MKKKSNAQLSATDLAIKYHNGLEAVQSKFALKALYRPGLAKVILAARPPPAAGWAENTTILLAKAHLVQTPARFGLITAGQGLPYDGLWQARACPATELADVGVGQALYVFSPKFGPFFEAFWGLSSFFSRR